MLRFRLGPIPVGVHVSFLIIALLGPRADVGEIVAWTLAVFVAILLHEAGHAFTALGFGVRDISITLFAFGGATTYPLTNRVTPGRRFLITAAGSFVGMVAGGLLWAVAATDVFAEAGQLFRLGISSFIWASLIWGALNWIPILPLDGGQMLQSALELVAPARAVVISKVVSVIAGAGAVLLAIRFEFYFAAFFVVFIVLAGLRTPGPRPEGAPEAGTAVPEVEPTSGAEKPPQGPQIGPPGGQADGSEMTPGPDPQTERPDPPAFPI